MEPSIERAILLNQRSGFTKFKYLIAVVKLLILIGKRYEYYMGEPVSFIKVLNIFMCYKDTNE